MLFKMKIINQKKIKRTNHLQNKKIYKINKTLLNR